MKTLRVTGWLLTLMAVATVARAQDDPAAVYTGPAGIPGTPAAPAFSPPLAIEILNESAYEMTITPIDANTAGYFATSAIPGDVVLLADPAGGDAPSNWAAVAQFFNPDDATGSRGLLGTETEGFFPRDFGVNGFANFSLLPNVYYAPADSVEQGFASLAYIENGPAGAIPGGSEDFTTLAVTGVPEPGAVVPLALGAALLGAGALYGRKMRRACH